MTPKPVILAIDDDAQVLNAVERDLRQHYRENYRILKASSGAEALDTVRGLKQRGTPLALFLVDQRMPQMTGVEFLQKAVPFYPDARKVLLTAYADTEAAIASINQIGLDYYLMKPWSPPEENMYPVLDDVLSDWVAIVSQPYEGIRVAGTLWSATSHDIKDFLARNRIPYQWQDIEVNSEARAMVELLSEGKHILPVLFFPDGEVLINPDFRTLAEKVGLQTQASQPFYDVVIVGAGPAGLGAAVYAASEGLRTALIEREATGGQAGTSSRIENYLGFPNGLSGADLARRATAQARRFGVEILTTQEAVGVKVDGVSRTVVLGDGTELNCRALILATGVSVRKLDAPGIENLAGRGVYYGAAMTEAASFRDHRVFVVGGANSAGQGAIFLARYARQVTLLVRSSALENGMSQYLVDQIQATPNIEVLLNTEVMEACGDDHLEGVTIIHRETNEMQRLDGAAMFIFVGATAHTDMVAGVIERNRAGFILTGADLLTNNRRPENWTANRDPYLLETSIPGIFAVGDVRQGAVRRVASAVGEGAIAVSLVHQYLRTV